MHDFGVPLYKCLYFFPGLCQPLHLFLEALSLLDFHAPVFLPRLAPLWLCPHRGVVGRCPRVLSSAWTTYLSLGNPTHPCLISKPFFCISCPFIKQPALWTSPCEYFKTLRTGSFPRLSSRFSREFSLCWTIVRKWCQCPSAG